MNRQELQEKLRKMGIRESRYNISQSGNDDEKYNLVQENGEWIVYYGERGQRSNPTVFDTEDAACNHLYEILTKDSVRRVELPSFLPIGSVVMLKEGNMKLMIAARALHVKNRNGKILYFDYGAFPYPQGMIGTEMAYFQTEAIREILYMGYIDESERELIGHLQNFKKNNPDIPKGGKDNW